MYDYSIPNSSFAIPEPVKLLPNGHMMMILYASGGPPGGVVQEIDLAGNIIRQFTYSDVNQRLNAAGYNIQVYSIDHDFVALPNGHLLLILSDYPDFYGPARLPWTDDRVWQCDCRS